MAQQPKNKTGNIFDWPLLKRVLRLAWPYRRLFLTTFFLAISLAVIGPFRPFLIQKTVDEHILQFDLPGLWEMTMLLVGILVIESLLRYFFLYSSKWLGQYIIRDLRERVFKHVLSLELKYFDTTPIGTSTTRTINDVETINDIFANGIITIIADILTIIVVIGFMVWTDWQLALISLSILPVFLYATYLFKEGIKDAFQVVRNQVSNMNAFLQEHITGMRIVQLFNAEERELEKFDVINNKLKDAHVRSIWYYSIFFPAIEILLAVGVGLMVWWASRSIMEGTQQVGVIIGFILYLNMLFRPLRFIADRFNVLQMGLVASNRVFDLLDREDRIENNGQHQPKHIDGAIEFKDVWFAYKDDDYVLKGVNFDLQPGETLAIVGATGSGKTSTINTLSRFYPIQQGSICLDGVNIEAYELGALRGKMSVVLQDVFLFSGTIYDNITLNNHDIPKEKVVAAAKMIGAHQFIEQLPGAYDFNVMERGATLSLGQRQLISFIRALVFDPSILILDEATASIDTESELLIQRAIEQLVEGRTSIVIAHRLSTIQNADKIMVMDKGQVMEIGSHSELIQREDGWYRKLHDMQFAEKLNDKKKAL